jgi:hypothetical protein
MTNGGVLVKRCGVEAEETLISVSKMVLVTERWCRKVGEGKMEC